MNKILILGGSGLVGKAIANEMDKFHNKFDVYTTYFKNPASVSKNKSFKLDIEDSNNIKDILDILKPEIVISCLRGDFNRQLDIHIRVAEYLRNVGGRLYFCSTTNVFDNDLNKPHYEYDITSSCTDYGRYKLECEKTILKILSNNACILRLPQIWGKNSPRMLNLINSLVNKEKIVVYPNLFINTITDTIIAKKVCYIIEHNLTGKFHIASSDIINYKNFYCKLANGLGFNNAVFEEDFQEKGYFAILSERDKEFINELNVTNQYVIDYLCSDQVNYNS